MNGTCWTRPGPEASPRSPRCWHRTGGRCTCTATGCSVRSTTPTVLAYSPAETAELLDTSVAAANSLLQRAWATLKADHGRGRSLDAADRHVVARFVEAWQRRDIPALAALLAEDAVLRMPPQRAEFIGRTVIADFFATVPADGRLDLIDLLVIRANGQPALGAYLPDQRGDWRVRDHGPRHRRRRDRHDHRLPGSRAFAAFSLPMSTPGSA
jgi:ketosteroid isomerase-like protein